MIETHSIFVVLVAILDIVAIISVLGGTSDPLRKVIWILVILALPLLGMLLYFLLGRSPADR